MDQTPYYSLILIISLLVTLLSVFFLKPKPKPKNQLRLPPGPWRLPIIGNLHQLLGRLPCYTLQSLSRRYGPLVLIQLGKKHRVIVSSPEAVKEMMKTHDIAFANRPASATLRLTHMDITKGLIFPFYGDYWRQMRKICNQDLLCSKKVQSFISIRKEEVANVIQLIKSDSSSQNKMVNLTNMLEMMVNYITIRTMLGRKYGMQNSYMEAVRKVSELGAGYNLVDMFPSSRLVRLLSPALIEARRCRKYISRTLDDFIKQQNVTMVCQRDKEVEDLLNVLLRIHEDGTADVPLDIESIKAFLTELFATSIDTTMTVLEWAMAELMRNPRVMEKAQLEVRQHDFKECMSAKSTELPKLNYMHQVIKETLRLHPPIPIIPRKQMQQETCVVLGYDIPKGTTMLVNVWAIARDPKYWEDPEEFKPERFNNRTVDFHGMDLTYIPFGAGRRICPGITSALATVELALASLLYHFDWELPDGLKPEEIDMSASFRVAMNKKHPLWLRAIPYKTSVEEA